jgi:proteasome assembly chaperone (PAC2) family protein
MALPKRFSVTLTGAELAKIPGAKVDTVSRIAYVDSSQLVKLNKAQEIELPKQEPKSSIVAAAEFGMLMTLVIKQKNQ